MVRNIMSNVYTKIDKKEFNILFPAWINEFKDYSDIIKKDFNERINFIPLDYKIKFINENYININKIILFSNK